MDFICRNPDAKHAADQIWKGSIRDLKKGKKHRSPDHREGKPDAGHHWEIHIWKLYLCS